MGPTQIIKKKNINKMNDKRRRRTREQVRKFFFYFLYFSLPSLFDSRSSDRQNSSGQTRKVLYATRATREYQKHEISPKIQVNIRKILVFSFSQIYDVLLVL